MIKLFILLSMLFLHIVDDYYLQGILAKLKQKSWWEENYPNKMYKNDYIIALIEHAFSWTFMIMLPIGVYFIFNNITWENITIIFSLIFGINWLIHAYIDNAKANNLTINLITDQLVHIAQVFLTWFMVIVLPK